MKNKKSTNCKYFITYLSIHKHNIEGKEFLSDLTDTFLFKSSDVKDIHDWLEITVYDEDKDHSYEFLGKVKILCWSVTS